MKVFAALTLLSLAAMSQAYIKYQLQCTRDEVGIRWPSYHSHSEYYVCEGVYGNLMTVHCSPGEVFTFVLQQCAPPSLYVPAPPLDMLPAAAAITMENVEDEPETGFGLLEELDAGKKEPSLTSLNHHNHQLSRPLTPTQQQMVDSVEEEQPEAESQEIPEIFAAPEQYPTPPTPPTEPPTPPLLSEPVMRPPGPSAPNAPVAPPKAQAAKKNPTPPKAGKAPTPTAKKPAPPSKVAKKPAPPSKVAKKPAPPSKVAKKPAA